MAKKKISAIIYARQSSGSDEQSDSVDTQEANCMEYCKRMGYEVKLVAHDLNTSGRTYPISGASVAEQDLAFQCEFCEEIYYKSETTGCFRGRPRFLPLDTWRDL